MLKALATLPRGLDDTYVRIEKRIEDQPDEIRDLALAALMWILYAERPLHPSELQHALATERAYEMKASINVQPVEVTLEACGNLITVESGVVRPMHYSVQEFLTDGKKANPEGYLRERLSKHGHVHASLASTCVKYLLSGSLTQPQAHSFKLYRCLLNASFACYAGHYFDFHAMQSADTSHLGELLEKILGQEERSLAAILQIRMANDTYWMSPQWKTFQYIKFRVSASTMVYATRLFESEEIKNKWLEATIPLYALHHASMIGSQSAVRHLLELGANTKAADAQGVYTLYYGALEGHVGLCSLLLDHGADVNAQGGHHGNALQAACVGGHMEVVKTLLDKDAEVNAQGGVYGNALQAACVGGHMEVVELLQTWAPTSTHKAEDAAMS